MSEAKTKKSPWPLRKDNIISVSSLGSCHLLVVCVCERERERV